LTNLANETGTTSGTFNFCSYMEDLHQPPDSKTEKSCPPDTGPAVLDYIMWFARGIFPPVSGVGLVAPRIQEHRRGC
jgi:hypothetical protein